MAEYRPAEGDQAEYLDALVAAGLVVPTGVDGVFGRGPDLEAIVGAFNERVSRAASDDEAEALAFPPVISRHAFETSGYLKSFPHLAGTVFAFEGDEQQAQEQQDRAAGHEDWSEHQHMSDMVLTPAACYPVYPAVAERGPLPEGGVSIDTGAAYVFRREPSGDPARMQMFRIREIVRIARPEVVRDWRDKWRDRSIELLEQLGLDAEFDVAADPFFGRAGRMLAASQREQALKFEVLVPIAGPKPTAVASFNYHEDHFSSIYGLRMADGGEAHTACLGFGMERVAFALIRVHGMDPASWPSDVRRELWPA